MKNTLSTEDLAKRLGKAPRTIINWRWAGRGPKYRKIGKTIEYTEEAVEEWLDAHTVEPKQVA